MKTKRKGNLDLGSNVVELLLPHRRPLLMVDGIVSYGSGPTPRLEACRHISANEDIFRGHFSDLHLWPGIYTIEGLGQSSHILYLFVMLERFTVERGDDLEQVLAALRNLELGYTLHPGFKPELAATAHDILAQAPRRLGVSGAVEMKFLSPVFAGCRLDYDVALTHEMGDNLRFEVEASVDGRPVARGTITGNRGFDMPRAL